MENSNDNKSDGKYENQIQLRKAKLEKIRKERRILQFEKLKRELTAQENLEEIHLVNEIREKASKINDSKIDKIHREINMFRKDTENSSTAVMYPLTNQIRSVKQTLNLKHSNLQITEIPPIHTATFSKHTQTEISQLFQNVEPKNCEYDDAEYQDQNDVETPLRLFCSFSSNLPPGILSPGLPKVMDIPPAITPIDKENPWNYYKEKSKKIVEYEYKEMLSVNFQKSLTRASLVMESVLSNNKNIYIDYIGHTNGYWNTNDNNSMALLHLKNVFCNKDQTGKRCITCIDWSPHYPDQIATSYYKTEESTFDAGEDVKIWNRNLKNQMPEKIFHSHSSVMSMGFTKSNPHLILGATYSGQIVLWDSRVKTSIPLQCSKLNSKAHTQPIYCLREVCCESSHYIISISTDGKLCLWNLEMLSQPIDIMQLQLNISNKIKNPIPVTCMDFPANGINNIVLGGEDGCAYSAFRYGYESAINNRYGKHKAPITGISSHYNQTTTEFGNLFLTSSIDCTTNLWSMEREIPLHTFKNNNDYVMDVAWSPIHPAIFIAVDGSGCVDLYNLNENFEEPIKSINIKEGTAINRLAWTSDGQHVAFGNEHGELYLYKIAEELANPGSEEWDIFKETLNGKSVNHDIEFYD